MKNKFKITSNGDMKSCGLSVYEVHYLFIIKKWCKTDCLITDNNGVVMNYNEFNNSYPV